MSDGGYPGGGFLARGAGAVPTASGPSFKDLLVGKPSYADTPPLSGPVSQRRPYRADIDGLRAIAVWSVVLFHTELGIVSGGFVGVDVFFVISGYLITGILLREQAEGRFSLLDFYERRVRRIFPALFAMLAICSIAALVLMLPGDLKDYGLNLAGASGSVSNFTLLAQVDYFDGAAKLKPLLHTWSLGIEEQFYLFWPMMLLLVQRSRAMFLAACSAVAAISFGGSLWFLATKPDEVFYLLPFRAWELLLGGMVAAGVLPALRGSQLAGIVAAAGLALIVYAIVAFSERMAFPGAAALVPCVGAGLIIWAGRDCSRNLVARLLAAPALVFSGKISYSLYLWHWPLFAFLRYRMIEEPGPVLMLLLLPITFLCATLSWYYVERPFRTKRWLPTRRGALLGGAAAVICGVALGCALNLSSGLSGRFPAQVNRLAMQGEETDPFKRCSWRSDHGPRCVIGDPGKVDAMLWGDSHAGTLWAAVEPVTALTGVQYAANSACPPGLELATSAACLTMNRADLRFALDHPEVKVVILAARWSLYLKGRALGMGPAETNAGLPQLRWSDGQPVDASTSAVKAALGRDLGQLVARLLAAGKTVVIVYPVPEVGYDVPFTLARLEQRGEALEEFARPLDLYLGRQREAFQMLDALGTHPGLRRVYPHMAICPENLRCLTNLAGRSLYTDSNHLSRVGARMLGPLIADALR